MNFLKKLLKNFRSDSEQESEIRTYSLKEAEEVNSMPTGEEFQRLPKLAKAAYAAHCLAVLDSELSSVRSPKVLIEALASLVAFASGKIDKLPATIIDEARNEVVRTRALKAAEAHTVEGHGNYHVASTARYEYDASIFSAIATLEAVRLNLYQLTSAVLTARFNDAIAYCDGDPAGAVAGAISDVRTDLPSMLRQGFFFVSYLSAHPASGAFPEDFLEMVTVFEPPAEEEGIDFDSYSMEEKSLPSGPADLDRIRSSYDYEVFISFKNLDRTKQPTEDALMAESLHKFLTSQEIRVFFSNISLKTMGVTSFQKAIDDALDSCQILVAVGTSKENLESPQVRYEWDSFHNDILSGIKQSGRIFSYVKDLEIRNFPRRLRSQTIIPHSECAIEKLYEYIENARI